MVGLEVVVLELVEAEVVEVVAVVEVVESAWMLRYQQVCTTDA